MRASVLAAVVVAFSVAFGRNLDRIDAEGVTERGGSANYARMLTRTGLDGRLSATLLPPVADWASRPVPRMYYMASSSDVQGNGAPQYPFTNLTYALSHVAQRSVLIIAPGTYSGNGTIVAGDARTLLGMGGQVYISSLSVTVSGSSSSTMLDLCGLRIGTLSVYGGLINLRLAGTSVDRLAGDAAPVTVTRTDMASRIGVSTLAYADVYSGHMFAPEAGAVVGPAGSRLFMSGGRCVVSYGASTNTLAYVYELADATNAVYSSMGELASADANLAAQILSEASARTNGDTSLSNLVASVASRLSSDIDSIGSRWDSSFSTVRSNISSANAAISALSTREANDYATLNAAISQTGAGYAAADAVIRESVNDVSSALASLERSLPALIDERTSGMITAAANDAVTRAVSSAEEYTDGVASGLGSRIDGVISVNSSQNTTIAAHTSSIGALESRVDSVSTGMSTLGSSLTGLNDRVSSLESSVAALGSWKLGIDSWKLTTSSDIQNIKNRINSIITCLAAITNKAHLTGISLPSRF